jgi:predicted amidohydrolase
MNHPKHVSRRNFLRQSSIGLGAGIVGTSIPSCESSGTSVKKLPGDVCLASIDLKGLWPDTTTESRIKRILSRMEDIAGIKPDILCLPELFDNIWVNEEKPLDKIAQDEKIPGPVTSIISEFAKKNNCYVLCPVYTKSQGHFYNSSLLIDRKGDIAGAYHKMHPTKTEIVTRKGTGVAAGALDQSVIETDFGKVGMVICYDANWLDVWDNWKKQGADVIFFSSAFPGGRILNYYAWRNDCYIVSSTGGDARIIDKSGNDLDSTSTFVRYAWANVNVNKVCVGTWPARDRLPEIFRKYGDQLEIKVWDNTDVITIESRVSGLKVSDVLKEFKIQTNDELLKETEEAQAKYRL